MMGSQPTGRPMTRAATFRRRWLAMAIELPISAISDFGGAYGFIRLSRAA